MRRDLWPTSYRRRALDADLRLACASLTGLVVDLGGERQSRRGGFRPPSRPDLDWLCINLDPGVAPDLVGDACRVPLQSECADAVVCTELLEHVVWPERVVAECARLLRPGGQLMLSMPFLVRIHGDPGDYQRFTDSKLAQLITRAGLTTTTMRKQGLYLTVLADMLKTVIQRLRPAPVRWTTKALALPVLELLIRLERRPSLAASELISSYTTGFFAIAVRPDNAVQGGPE